MRPTPQQRIKLPTQRREEEEEEEEEEGGEAHHGEKQCVLSELTKCVGEKDARCALNVIENSSTEKLQKPDSLIRLLELLHHNEDAVKLVNAMLPRRIQVIPIEDNKKLLFVFVGPNEKVEKLGSIVSAAVHEDAATGQEAMMTVRIKQDVDDTMTTTTDDESLPSSPTKSSTEGAEKTATGQEATTTARIKQDVDETMTTTTDDESLSPSPTKLTTPSTEGAEKAATGQEATTTARIKQDVDETTTTTTDDESLSPSPTKSTTSSTTTTTAAAASSPPSRHGLFQESTDDELQKRNSHEIAANYNEEDGDILLNPRPTKRVCWEGQVVRNDNGSSSHDDDETVSPDTDDTTTTNIPPNDEMLSPSLVSSSPPPGLCHESTDNDVNNDNDDDLEKHRNCSSPSQETAARCEESDLSKTSPTKPVCEEGQDFPNDTQEFLPQDDGQRDLVVADVKQEGATETMPARAAKKIKPNKVQRLFVARKDFDKWRDVAVEAFPTLWLRGSTAPVGCHLVLVNKHSPDLFSRIEARLKENDDDVYALCKVVGEEIDFFSVEPTRSITIQVQAVGNTLSLHPTTRRLALASVASSTADYDFEFVEEEHKENIQMTAEADFLKE